MESDPWNSSTILFVKAEASLVDTVGGLLHTLVGDASKSPPSRHQHPDLVCLTHLLVVHLSDGSDVTAWSAPAIVHVRVSGTSIVCQRRVIR